MRKQILSAAVLMMMAVLPACKKDDTTANNGSNNNNNNNNNTPTYFFKAKINGVLYEGKTSYASHMVTGSFFGTTITYNGETTAFMVGADDFSGVKEYDDENSSIDLGDTGEGYSDFLDGNSNVKITSDDGTTVKGEFSGKLYSYIDNSISVEVTEGSFSAKWSN